MGGGGGGGGGLRDRWTILKDIHMILPQIFCVFWFASSFKAKAFHGDSVVLLLKESLFRAHNLGRKSPEPCENQTCDLVQLAY